MPSQAVPTPEVRVPIQPSARSAAGVGADLPAGKVQELERCGTSIGGGLARGRRGR